MLEDHVSHAASRDFASHAPGPCCEANAEATPLDQRDKFAVANVHAGLTDVTASTTSAGDHAGPTCSPRLSLPRRISTASEG